MTTSQKSRAVAPAPAAGSWRRCGCEPKRAGAEPGAGARTEESAAIEALRRQVIALQRISSLGVLAGGVFHELNNALTPILNYAKLGLRNPDPAYRERALTQIVEAAQRAATITRGMLGLSRPGANIDHREPTDLARLVGKSSLLVKKDMARHRVRLDVKLAGEPWARVNPAQIQQVLLNLLINARQAMPEGGHGAAPAGPGRHRPAGRDERRRHRRRDRAGRPAADLRAVLLDQDRPDAAGQGGTGLGLAVCRDIVEAHHGRLRAESRLGQGSTFTIILPACPPAEAAAEKQGAA